MATPGIAISQLRVKVIVAYRMFLALLHRSSVTGWVLGEWCRQRDALRSRWSVLGSESEPSCQDASFQHQGLGRGGHGHDAFSDAQTWKDIKTL